MARRSLPSPLPPEHARLVLRTLRRAQRLLRRLVLPPVRHEGPQGRMEVGDAARLAPHEGVHGRGVARPRRGRRGGFGRRVGRLFPSFRGREGEAGEDAHEGGDSHAEERLSRGSQLRRAREVERGGEGEGWAEGDLRLLSGVCGGVSSRAGPSRAARLWKGLSRGEAWQVYLPDISWRLLSNQYRGSGSALQHCGGEDQRSHEGSEENSTPRCLLRHRDHRPHLPQGGRGRRVSRSGHLRAGHRGCQNQRREKWLHRRGHDRVLRLRRRKDPAGDHEGHSP
mmetsp:Transcript_47127/g.100222  ORF Transcript_47127/g.100222 Transcript_47127/m.100222 type:complete len:282 (-) Transcript_47127:550-1395(-)